MPQRLPSPPNLDHLKKQAKHVLRVARHRNPRWRLTDAQHAVAHGYGFESWPALKVHVESVRQRRSAAFAPREAPGAPAGDATSGRLDTAIHVRHSRASHPLVGTWAMRPSASAGGRAHVQMDHMVLEFELTDRTVTLTQLAVDSTGRHSATKSVIQVDGQGHPAEFGEGLVLHATWTNSRTLELIFKDGETVVGEWAYEASGDGRSLIVSTTERAFVFERVE